MAKSKKSDLDKKIVWIIILISLLLISVVVNITFRNSCVANDKYQECKSNLNETIFDLANARQDIQDLSSTKETLEKASSTCAEDLKNCKITLEKTEQELDELKKNYSELQKKYDALLKEYGSCQKELQETSKTLDCGTIAAKEETLRKHFQITYSLISGAFFLLFLFLPLKFEFELTSKEKLPKRFISGFIISFTLTMFILGYYPTDSYLLNLGIASTIGLFIGLIFLLIFYLAER